MQSLSSHLPTGAWPADSRIQGTEGPVSAVQGEVRKEEERCGDRALDLRE